MAPKEATHVRFLAETARPSEESPYIKHLEYSDFPNDVKLVEVIHEALAQGNPVVLRGYNKYESIEPSTESIFEKLAIQPSRKFDAQGKYSRPLCSITLISF